jgi:hypothetical protein
MRIHIMRIDPHHIMRIDFASGRQLTAKNLGWLHRHTSDLEQLVITHTPDGGAHVEAFGRDWHGVTDFASFQIAQDWARTRKFAHVQVDIHAPVLTDDTLRALYVLAADYHSGFGSRGYRFMCHVTRLLNHRGLGASPDRYLGAGRLGWGAVRRFPEYTRYLPLAERYF